ncbi:MAG: FAD-dependent oxidoreductase [Verrucomicrobiota bacterium]|nr:FAD-dependent oxidoreductase [Verrucomicrobiota bacterium]
MVGAGIAGCLLAWRLKKAGKSVVLISNSKAPSASAVAAGVINPVTGRWAVKSWRVDDLLPEAERLYRALEKELNIDVYHPMPLRRFCKNKEDQKRIGRRLRNLRYADVISDFHQAGDSPENIKDSYGSFDILRAAYVDLPKLLESMRGSFRCVDTQFDHAALRRNGDCWKYKEFKAPKVIFSEGAAMNSNPWFSILKSALTPIKGETLSFECRKLKLPRSIYHNGKWLIAYGGNRFRIGATYSQNFDGDGPSKSAAKELLDSVRTFAGEELWLDKEKQLAGIRPCTFDTRPLLGAHPTEAGLYLFNGLGSKGGSVAPLMSRHFAEYLIIGAQLDPEVDIKRFLNP